MTNELHVDSLSKLRRLVEECSSLTKTTSVVDRHSTLPSVFCLDCLIVVTFFSFSAQSSVVSDLLESGQESLVEPGQESLLTLLQSVGVSTSTLFLSPA